MAIFKGLFWVCFFPFIGNALVSKMGWPVLRFRKQFSKDNLGGVFFLSVFYQCFYFQHVYIGEAIFKRSDCSDPVRLKKSFVSKPTYAMVASHE